ncbi:uncharacterized protein DDB_G0283357-like [Limulus polyphemus]|uniref:Uncharacterized protein DDB_G0283357-like n=1 Tax=Limulus polyphemus TaxID=6850 RepID=A0ABM1BTG0_LIMPO|nr:uncharacterized protein DDB_G0283357-like [Limulus polyphemus]
MHVKSNENPRQQDQNSARFQTSINLQQLQKSHYQFPLPPQPQNWDLPPKVRYHIQNNVQSTPLQSQDQQYQPPYQPLSQIRNRPQYQPPVLPQQSNTEPQFNIQDQQQQYQYVPQSQFQPSNPQPSVSQQVIYINGQPVVINTSQGSRSTSPTGQQESDSQGISFSTSHSTELIHQEPEKTRAVQPSVQSVIQKIPASEIEFDKKPIAKDKASNEDDYVIYYYYYYEDDKANKTNPTLSLDDIPNLESYDHSQGNYAKDKPEKSNRRLNISQNVTNNAFKDHSSFSVSQSLSLPFQTSFQDAAVTGVSKTDMDPSISVSISENSTISNTYRYGNNVLKFPISPNLVAHQTGGQIESPRRRINNDVESSSAIGAGPSSSGSIPSPTSNLSANNELNREKNPENINELTVVQAITKPTEASFITTTEATTRTEEPTTTTERSRRLTFGSRRGFSTRRRQPISYYPRRPTLSTTTTADFTTTEETTTRRDQSRAGSRYSRRNRFRSSFRRNRFDNSSDDGVEENERESTTTTESSRWTTKRRFGGFRRYGNSRNSNRGSTERTENMSTTESSGSRPSFLSRKQNSKTPSLPFLRGGRRRFGYHNEEEGEVENTTDPSTSATDASKITVKTPVTEEAPKEIKDRDLTAKDDQETTTTESSRFSGLFRQRKRPSFFGKRPSFLSKSR